MEGVLTNILLILFGALALSLSLIFWQKRRKLYATAQKLPGPLSLPLIGSAFHFFGKDSSGIYNKLIELLNIYPGLFRFWFGTRLFYIVSDPKYFNLLATHPNVLKKEKLYDVLEPLAGQGLITIKDVKMWRRNRKLIMPAFSQRILDRFNEVFVQQAEVLCEVLKKHCGKQKVDLMRLVSNYTLDIICQTAMGVNIEPQLTNSEFPKWLDEILDLATTRIFNLHYHWDFIYNLTPSGRRSKKIVGKMRSFVQEVIRQKKLENQNNFVFSEERPALLDLLLQTKNRNHQFTDKELLDETLTFVAAGTDTTAVTNCFILTMLALHQEIQQAVFEEISEVVGNSSSIQLDHLPKLNLLERVIKETLRLFPAAVLFVRAVEADVDIGECIVHKGCSVLFAIRHVHTNEKYWPNPLEFDPDRFLPEKRDTVGAYYPFVIGPRACIGLTYAMMAMKSVTATVLRKYKFFTSYKSVSEIELKIHLVLRPLHGFKVTFEKR